MSSHPSGRTLALTLSAGYLVVAGAFGTILLTTGGDEGLPIATPVPESADPAEPTLTPTRRTTTRTTTSTRRTTTTTSAAPTGYRRVVTSAGMSTVVPTDWPVFACASGNGCEQATDPADPQRYLRFGGSPSPSGDLGVVQSTYERQFSQREGYRRIRFESLSYHGYPAVEWEFEWFSGGALRHVRALYWRAAGDDNIVYASSTADTWEATLPLYENMIAYSTP